MQLSDFGELSLAFDNYEDAYEVVSRAMLILDSKRGYITVEDIWHCAEMSRIYSQMNKWGWNSIEDFHIVRDGLYYILKMPPARPIEEFQQNKEMNKKAMDLRTELTTNTSVATVDWAGTTYTLENVTGTFNNSWGCPGNITISGDTIGIGTDYANKTDYSSFFRNTRDYCEDNIKKMEDKMNTALKRNGKAVEAAKNFKKIEVYNDRVVKITFADGTYTKAVCSDADEFCLDTGIMVCVMKKLFGGQKEGTKLIASMLNNAHAQMEKQENDKIEAELKAVAEKQKKRKAELKKAAKAMKAKEEAIDIQKQAYIRAMQEMGMTKDE